MLEYLRIRNLALIENMELEFARGMNVITGETGAGKSFILKAISFLLGEKLNTQMIRPTCDKAQVEALFILGEQELILRRELIAETGRSRLYCNDQLISQEKIKELKADLIVHTSQHGQQRLLSPAYQANLFDSLINNDTLINKKNNLLKELHILSEKRNSLLEKFNYLKERKDLLEIQQSEINQVNPQIDEEEILETQKSDAKEKTDLIHSYEKVFTLLHGDNNIGLLDLLNQLENKIQEIAKIDEQVKAELEEFANLRQTVFRLEQCFKNIPDNRPTIDIDSIEKRLYELAQLKRKLKRPLNEIILMRDEIANNLSFLDVCELDLNVLNKEETGLVAELEAIVAQIILVRKNTALSFTKNLEAELAELGFSEQVKVYTEFSQVKIWDNVFDEKGRILWSPNPGQQAQPLDLIASGGELSRFLLAIIGIQKKSESATYIFDEVDAGVGGLTLNKVAERLESLSKQRQMLLITHWPQLAIRAEKHFLVQKTFENNTTFVNCSPLTNDEIKLELARMAGGGKHGEAMAKAFS